MPGVLEQACLYRDQFLSGHRLNPLAIFARCINKTESDFIVFFALNLLEACSKNPLVPTIICRIILNNLYIQVHEYEIIWTEFHSEVAMAKVDSIRCELLFDYVKKLGLEINESKIISVAQKQLEDFKYSDAAVLIYKFALLSHFNIQELLENLVHTKDINMAKLLCENSDNLRKKLIDAVILAENTKVASSLIKEY